MSVPYRKALPNSAVKTTKPNLRSFNTKEAGRGRALQTRKLFNEMANAKAHLDQAKRLLVKSRISRRDPATVIEFTRVFKKLALPSLYCALQKLKDFRRHHNERLVEQLVKSANLKLAQSYSLKPTDSFGSYSTFSKASKLHRSVTLESGLCLTESDGRARSLSPLNESVDRTIGSKDFNSFKGLTRPNSCFSDVSKALSHLDSIKRRLDFTESHARPRVGVEEAIAERHKQVNAT